MLGSLILYLKGMRIMMFQLSGFYPKSSRGAQKWDPWDSKKKSLWPPGCDVTCSHVTAAVAQVAAWSA